ncbi:MAG: LAGLIDADG family homing endonuclease [Candidatus Babeliales bacterium]|jgi:hypothetical protein
MIENIKKMVVSQATELKILSPTEAAYLAGLIDGEGSFFIAKIKRKTKNGFTYTPTMVIINTSKVIIDLCNTYGGHYQAQEYTVNWKIVHRWFFSRRLVEHYLPQIMPYLRIKPEQAKVMMEAIAIPRGTGYDLTDEDFKKLNDCRTRLMKLNERGKRKGRNE